MKPRNTLLIFSLLSAIQLSGCAFSGNPYGASAANVAVIKDQQIPPVAVETFNSFEPGRRSLMCRGIAPIETSDGVSFESYIEKALIDELALAGSYDPNSPIAIRGRLDDIDFSSSVGSGIWVIKLTISSKRNPGYTVESSHEFSTSFFGDKACQQVAQAFGPAVQSLIARLVSDSRFKSLTQ